MSRNERKRERKGSCSRTSSSTLTEKTGEQREGEENDTSVFGKGNCVTQNDAPPAAAVSTSLVQSLDSGKEGDALLKNAFIKTCFCYSIHRSSPRRIRKVYKFIHYKF